MGDLPPPLTPANCDLRDYPSLPVDITRLFGSNFHATAKDAEWRAGVTLWMKSFHQVPAASLPEDDAELTMLADLGRDQKTWRKLKAKALQGWFKCSDGRLYHKVVAEKALIAWIDKLSGRKSSAAGNAKRWDLRFDPAQFERALHEAAGLLAAINPSTTLLKKRVLRGYGEDSRQAAEAPDAGSKADAYSNPTGIAGGSPAGISTSNPTGIATKGKAELEGKAEGKNLSQPGEDLNLSERSARGVSEFHPDENPFGEDDRYPDMDEVVTLDGEILEPEPPAARAPKPRQQSQTKHAWPADGFEQLWAFYPEKASKKPSFQALDKIRRADKVPFVTILAGLRRYVETKPPDRNWCHLRPG